MSIEKCAIKFLGEERGKCVMCVKRIRFDKDKDKGLFFNMWQSIRGDPKISLVLIVGSICLWVLMLLRVEWRTISDTTFEYSSIAVVIAIIVIGLVLKGVKKKSKTKPKKDYEYDPVSIGTLYFGFAMSLLTIWASEQISGQPINDWKTLIIAGLASLISLTSIIAVYIQRLRTYLSKKVTPNSVSLTLIVSLGSFAFCVLSLPSSFPKTYQTIVEVVMYFGFAWIVTMMLIMFRDVKNDLTSIVVIILLIITGIAKLCKEDWVSVISGFILLAIALLVSLVVTRRLKPYGKVG